MSMYPNSAHMANSPAQSATQRSMINGAPHSTSMQPTMQQQQQQVLQQKQQVQQQQYSNPQQQQAKMSPSLSSSSISKFLPPTTAPPSSSGMAPPTSNLPMSQTRPANFAPPQLANGPINPLIQSTQAPTHLANSLPPHLRPPGLNGIHSNNSQLMNGGGASEAGANSSRTASPALQNVMPTISAKQQPQKQHYMGTTAMMPTSQFPPPPSFSQAQMAMHVATSTTAAAAAATTTVPSNVGALAGSVKNLNLNHQNGAQNMLQRQQPPPMMAATSNLASPSNNLHKNFKTTALNPPQQQQPLTEFKAPLTTTSVAQSQYSPLMQQSYKQMPPPPPSATIAASVSQKPSTSHPTNATNYVQPPPQVGQKTMPPLPQSNLRPSQTAYQQNAVNVKNMMSVPPNVATPQQNQFNNNQQQQAAAATTAAVAPPPPPQSMQRRPMYPTANALPPMPPPTSSAMQPQQAYAQVYHQQQQQLSPTQPGMFNGQHNTGPLQYQNQQAMAQAPQQYGPSPQSSVLQQGFNRLWGQDTIDLMQNRHILTSNTLMPPKVTLHNQFQESVNCNPHIMRCTIAKIPESNALLQKSRLPLGIVIHPFRDINSLPVIQCPNIVRCRLCRTYINPFVYFVDSKMWKCNLCYRTNELPEDFQFDPATKTYGDVTRRPEVRSSTIEFIAPSEYMLRPPPPAMYLFLFDVSIIAQQCGYLENVCATLNKHLDDMPGDARTQVGFIAFNSQVHFYSMAEGYNQPHEMTLLDIDDPFLPRPDNLLVNLKECKELVKDLLTQLPKRFADTHDPGTALGTALQVAYKLMQTSGGRVTVFQTCLPNKGPGSLEPREDPNNRSAKDIAHLNPATDFYKRYALDSSGYQIAVDLFLLNQQYSDLATISGVSKHSGGCVHHFPLYQKTKPQHVESLKQCFKRYLTRKIGFEAVMRIRCTRGLQVHTFHGNFFVRSTDLLSLPNVNPDAGYGMQISYEETLSEVKTICFQAALLYTNSEGERRIRVHTLCLPVTASLPEIMHAADTEAIIGLLSKMAVDRSLTSNVADAREAFLNATIDIFNAFKVAQNLPSGQSGQLIAPRCLALLPLYILALLKHRAFRVGTSTRLDDRVFAMDCMKTLPLDQLMKYIYPEFYQIDVLFYKTQNPNAIGNSNTTEDDEEEDYLPEVPRLQLSAEFLDSRATFLMDCGTLIIIYVGLNVPASILESVFGIKSTAELPDYYYGLPNVSSPENDALRRFILRLNEDKPYAPTVQIIRDTSTAKPDFIERLVDDRTESSFSYYEFLQHIRAQVK